MKASSYLLLLALAMHGWSQDIMTTQKGEDMQVRVLEITPEEVKYRKHIHPDGPIYTIKKSEVFMITYENGTKDVFSENTSTSTGVATIYFYRPKKFTNSGTKVIIGTVDPDEVVVKLKNGSWFKSEYPNMGERQFAAGVFVINPEFFKIHIDAGLTYYFRCTVITKGMKVMAGIEFVEEEVARKEIAELKEQGKSYVN